MFVQRWSDSVRNGILTPTLQYAQWMRRIVRQKLATLTLWVATKLHRAVSLSKFLSTHFLQSCVTGKWMETSFVSYMTALTQVRPANPVLATVTSFRFRYPRHRNIKPSVFCHLWYIYLARPAMPQPPASGDLHVLPQPASSDPQALLLLPYAMPSSGCHRNWNFCIQPTEIGWCGSFSLPIAIDPNRVSPRGGETICPPQNFPKTKICVSPGIRKSRRIYARLRTGSQSAHIWWPAVAKLQAASVPIA